MESWEFPELKEEKNRSIGNKNLDRLREIDVKVEAILGSCNRKIYDIMNLTKNDIILLDDAYGSLLDIKVNGIVIAKGEVVVIEDQLGIRIKELREK